MRTRIITSLAAAALIATSVAAQHPGRPVKQGGLGNVGRCVEVAQLTDEQKTQVRGIVEAAAPALRTLHTQLKTDREALRNLLEAGSTDACALGSAMLKVRSDEEAIRAEMDKLRASIEAVLTPEQKLRFEGCMDALRRHAAPEPPQ